MGAVIDSEALGDRQHALGWFRGAVALMCQSPLLAVCGWEREGVEGSGRVKKDGVLSARRHGGAVRYGALNFG